MEITENGTEQMFDNCGRTKQIGFYSGQAYYDSDFIICAEQEEQVHFIAAADNSVTDCHGN